MNIEKISDFLKAVPNIPKNQKGKEYKSICPCGGTITAVRSPYNGHLWAKCDKCGMTVGE